MRRLLTLSLVVCLFSQGLMAQDKTAMKYGNTITPQDMKAKLSVLASDEFMGRETGTEGQKMASRFLEDFYKKIGLVGPVNGTYRQKFSMYQSDWSDVYVKVKGKKKMNGKDFIFAGNANMDKEIKLTTVYIGDGSAISGMDIKDKGVIVTGSSREVQRSLIEAGVKAIFVASADDEQFMQTLPRQAAFRMKGRLRSGKENTGNESIVFNITKEMAADLLGSTSAKLDAAASSPSSIKEKSVSFQVKEKLAEISTENMVAYLEGTDLKDEVIVISSHFDHIGQNEDGTVINNGADDDGSGTTGVMEIAEAFAQAAKEGNRPRRSILFLNVTGEEKGLLGSAYYADNPLFPIENTVTNLNIDMIGRVDPEHENDRNYVYAIGSEKLSSHLKVVSEYANITYTGLNLDYRFDDPADTNRFYYRSDHYNFAKKGIPIIFYFNGVHADYHRPTDTVDKIEFDVMAQRGQLVFYTAWILANRDQRVPVDRTDDMTYNR
tara:strand:+ start:12907 stop:14385 length:1479 start_codon:yes stop_codon:yes gene_type:complete